MVGQIPHYSTNGTAPTDECLPTSTATIRSIECYCADLEPLDEFSDDKEHKIQQRSEWKTRNKAHSKARAADKLFLGQRTANRFNNRIRGNHVRHKRQWNQIAGAV